MSEMTKAWDLKNLVARAKEKSLPLLEKQAVQFIGIILDWTEDSIKMTDTKLDDLALMALPVVRAQAEKLAHKISPDDQLASETGEPVAENQPILPVLPKA